MFGFGKPMEKKDINVLAVTSFDPEEWGELTSEESERNGLHRTLSADDPDGNAKTLRKLFPLKARLKVRNSMVGMDAGHIFKYARIRRTPSRYPIEVFYTTRTSGGAVMTRKVMMDSAEVELLEP